MFSLFVWAESTDLSQPGLTPTDRAFWIAPHRLWPRWRELLVVVKPETVVRWHRKGFRLFAAVDFDLLRGGDGSAVDFLAVPDLHNVNDQCRIVHRVYDTVATLAYAVPVPLSS